MGVSFQCSVVGHCGSFRPGHMVGSQLPGLHGWLLHGRQQVASIRGSKSASRASTAPTGGAEDTGARLLAAREPVPPVKRRVRAVGQRLHGRAHQFPLAFLSVLLTEAHTQGRDLGRFPIAYEGFTPGLHWHRCPKHGACVSHSRPGWAPCPPPPCMRKMPALLAVRLGILWVGAEAGTLLMSNGHRGPGPGALHCGSTLPRSSAAPRLRTQIRHHEKVLAWFSGPREVN